MDEHLMQPLTSASWSSRPYRSHRVQACDRCRYRKVRCDLDLPGQACRFCRERKESCNYAPNVAAPQLFNTFPSGSLAQAHMRPSKRLRRSFEDGIGETTTSRSGAGTAPLRFSSVVGTSPTESSLIMDPHMSEDIAILEHYLSSRATEDGALARPYNTISTAPNNPIVYLNVPRKRKGLKSGLEPGRTQRDIIEQILRPFATEVQALYFDRFHPCFPILDEKTFAHMWQKDNDRISSALVCDIYASALPFWKCFDVLQDHPRPDAYFIWNQAVAALQDDFMAPTLSTIHAALLDITGRPVIHAPGNIINAGRIVTLAQSLGLHRDPTLWKATTHEKRVRIRLWWGVLIHDYWSSISHGIPPTIDSRYYDVPLPELEAATASLASDEQTSTNTSFLHLCKLSKILGDILPYVYTLQLDIEETTRNLRRAECNMDDWLAELPGYFRLDSPVTESVNGACNLWFSYLYIKIIIYRVAYKAALKDHKPLSAEARQYRQALLRDASSDIVDFVTELTEAQLGEFWMPYTSYLLVSAATVLLRCIIECGLMETKKLCASKLIQFIARLQSAGENSDWDLAEFCVERCSQPIQKIADALNITSHSTQDRRENSEIATILEEADNQGYVDAVNDGSAAMADIFLPMDSLDYQWKTLWDEFDGS